jgi:rhodanese-related sulfurtransferase
VRLARIGFDAVAGELSDVEAVLAARPELATAARRVPATELQDWLADEPELQVVDVRGPGEVAQTGAVPGALAIPLATFLDRMGDLDPARTTVVYCAGGYRSSIAASVLRANGFGVVADLIGGYGAWSTTTTIA